MTEANVENYPLKGDQARCQELGGHCYEVANIVLTSNPPVYLRTCKHCGHTQHGHSQPSIRWWDEAKA